MGNQAVWALANLAVADDVKQELQSLGAVPKLVLHLDGLLAASDESRSGALQQVNPPPEPLPAPSHTRLCPTQPRSHAATQPPLHTTHHSPGYVPLLTTPDTPPSHLSPGGCPPLTPPSSPSLEITGRSPGADARGWEGLPPPSPKPRSHAVTQHPPPLPSHAVTQHHPPSCSHSLRLTPPHPSFPSPLTPPSPSPLSLPPLSFTQHR